MRMQIFCGKQIATSKYGALANVLFDFFQKLPATGAVVTLKTQSDHGQL